MTLNPEERSQLKEKIQAEIVGIERDLIEFEADTMASPSFGAVGRLSRMDSFSRQEVVEAAMAAARLRLERLKTALRNADSSSYGICEECGHAIPIARLLLVPEATYCVRCAEPT